MAIHVELNEHVMAGNGCCFRRLLLLLLLLGNGTNRWTSVFVLTASHTSQNQPEFNEFNPVCLSQTWHETLMLLSLPVPHCLQWHQRRTHRGGQPCEMHRFVPAPTCDVECHCLVVVHLSLCFNTRVLRAQWVLHSQHGQRTTIQPR